jgi:hypothetical protein
MATEPQSDAELERALQKYRDWFDDDWVDNHVHADSTRRPEAWEIDSWRGLHEEGLRGAGIRVAVVDHFGGERPHGVAIEDLIRAIAPEAELLRVELPAASDGASEIGAVAAAIDRAGDLAPDVINLSFSHPVAFDDVHAHRDVCPAAVAATEAARRDPLCTVVAASGNAGLGVFGCPCLGRRVRRVGAVSAAGVPDSVIGALLAAGEVGTSFSAARISGFVALLASMYPGLSSRELFDAIGVVVGFTHWPSLNGGAEAAPLVRFYRSWISSDAMVAADWTEFASSGIGHRHELAGRWNARTLPAPASARLDGHRNRAWTLTGGIEARRNGKREAMDDRHESAQSWYRASIRLLERHGAEEVEIAKSRLALAGSLMDAPRQWTVVHSRAGAAQLDPQFAQVDELLQSTLATARKSGARSLESQSLNSLCALYQQHDYPEQLRQAERYGRQGLDLLGVDPKNEESVRAMLNLASAHYRLARLLPGEKVARLETAEQLVLNCVSDKYEDSLRYSGRARDLLARIRTLRG